MKTISLIIPTKIQNEIAYIINSDFDFINLTEKQKAKLSKTLLTIWYFIYQEQRNDNSTFSLNAYLIKSIINISKYY